MENIKEIFEHKMFDDTSDAYTKLFETYTKYKDLVKAGEEDSGTGDGTDTTTPVTTPAPVATPPTTVTPPKTVTPPSTGSGSTAQKVMEIMSKWEVIPSFRFINSFFNTCCFLMRIIITNN